MQTNQQLQESKELQPCIHTWIINYSFLNTYRRVFTNTFNERMMHFQVDVSICDASVVTSVLDEFACPCVSEWVGWWGVYLSQKLCWFLIRVSTCIHQFIYNYSMFVSGKTHAHSSNTHTHPQLLTSAERVLCHLPLFSRHPRAIIASTSKSARSWMSLNYKTIQGQLIWV